jgi:hypothetical protein
VYWIALLDKEIKSLPSPIAHGTSLSFTGKSDKREEQAKDFELPRDTIKKTKYLFV